MPDGEIFVVGGLTRENKAKTVEKVPILGDIPLLGKLFRKESSENVHRNLYVFLRAHVLTDEKFGDGKNIAEQARKLMKEFDADIPLKFDLDRPDSASKSASKEIPPSGGGGSASTPIKQEVYRRKKLRGWFE